MLQTMHGRIWEPQEPGQPPLSSQDLIGLFAGTGRAHRPLFLRWPMPLAAGGIVLGSTRARREERIAGNRNGSYPTFNCITSQGSIFFPHCPCWLFLDARNGETCKQLVSQNNYECDRCRTDSWPTYGRILPLTKAETRQFEKKQGETSGKVAGSFPRPSGEHSCSAGSWGVFTSDVQGGGMQRGAGCLGDPLLSLQ